MNVVESALAERIANPRASRRICIVTSAHISYNPRALKEADALAAAGYQIRVVGLNREDGKWRLDRQIAAQRPWTYDTVDARPDSVAGTLRRAFSRFRSSAYSTLAAPFPLGLEHAYSRYFPELLSVARTQPADLFIAHNLPALPVAAAAARSSGAKLGFDAEDFHRGEIHDEVGNVRLLRQTVAVEKKYIPTCDYVTAASEGIAAAYSQALGIREPTTILNVFPLEAREAPIDAATLRDERPKSGLSLYWYSQVIGPRRGLEVAVQALSRLDGRFSLALRGEWAEGYRAELMGLARQMGVDHLIRELGTSPPEQLVRRASVHDVGLASEMPDTHNRRIAVTNKLLVYLLAGIPAAVSDMPGQANIIRRTPGAGFVYAARDADALAAGLASYATSPENLARAKATARSAGESQYCWNIESNRLVQTVDNVFFAASPLCNPVSPRT